jgi:hypothetical protein
MAGLRQWWGKILHWFGVHRYRVKHAHSKSGMVKVKCVFCEKTARFNLKKKIRFTMGGRDV